MNNKETTEGKEYIGQDQHLDNEQIRGQNDEAASFENELEAADFDLDEAFEPLTGAQIKSEHSKNQDNNSAGNSKSPDLNSAENKNQVSDTERLKKDLTESNDKYLRLAAEFDNFRKRTSRERSEMFKTANKDVLVAVIPVLDDFDRSEKFMQNASDLAVVKEGVALISSKLRNILAQQGLKEMKSVGEPFDTDKHEAITNIPAPSEALKGKVVDETEKGYMLGDKVIRFAKVVVGQ